MGRKTKVVLCNSEAQKQLDLSSCSFSILYNGVDKKNYLGVRTLIPVATGWRGEKIREFIH